MAVTQEEFFHQYVGEDIWNASPTCYPELYLALTTPFQDFAIEFMGTRDTPFVQFKFGGMRLSDQRIFEALVIMTPSPERPTVHSRTCTRADLPWSSS
jgi:hypothetical protein